MEYQFRPIGKKCAATGEELAPGSLCHSVLIERDGELQRLDYSEKGWSGPPEGAIGVWTCQVPKPLEIRHEPLDTNALLRCFEQLSEEANPAREGLRYILALLLMKKRRLRLDSSRTEGADEYWQLSGAHGEGVWEVRDLQTTDEEVHQWQRELNVYLASEWQTGLPAMSDS
ncbi:MAG TPA: hypothetical protein VL475_14490 [Planctomycetaceae bacterium]|nr:hypothetical protein [Planctomycetaceae bacterium]